MNKPGKCRRGEKAAQAALCGKPYAPRDRIAARGKIHIRQRADRFNAIGRPKLEASKRTVPPPPMLIGTLREWTLACPKGELGLVVSSGTGAVESHANIVQRGLQPAMIVAKLTRGIRKAKKARYTGLHALQHFYASWCINRRVDGGLELPLKVPFLGEG